MLQRQWVVVPKYNCCKESILNHKINKTQALFLLVLSSSPLLAEQGNTTSWIQGWLTQANLNVHIYSLCSSGIESCRQVWTYHVSKILSFTPTQWWISPIFHRRWRNYRQRVSGSLSWETVSGKAPKTLTDFILINTFWLTGF